VDVRKQRETETVLRDAGGRRGKRPTYLYQAVQYFRCSPPLSIFSKQEGRDQKHVSTQGDVI
jgi:hypothetical protein